MNKKRRFTLFYCLFTLLLAGVLFTVARHSAGFSEWYASRLFPLFPHSLGRIFSLLPFSAFELLIVLAGVALLIFIAYSLFMLARGRDARAQLIRYWRLAGSCLAAGCCTLLLLFSLTCGINYSRAPLSTALGLQPRPSSVQELRLLYELLAKEAEQAAAAIQTDTLGYFVLQKPPQQESRAAMRQVGVQYSLPNTYYPRPKPVLLSIALSYLHIAGIYSPFTVEANYNRHMPPADIPFCICHELAHLSGYAREDEANFIAYLACRESDHSDFHYSGLLNAITYVMNALYAEVSVSEYRELLQKLPAQMLKDLQRNTAYWQDFYGPVSEFSQQVNDFYLKANDQPEGVKSYGRMVDLLLAYYFFNDYADDI